MHGTITTTGTDEFDLDDALDTVAERREERQQLREALLEGFKGLAAKNGWGNRDIDMTEERREAMEDLQAAGVGTGERGGPPTEELTCEMDGGHEFEETGTAVLGGVEVPRRECTECGHEQVNTQEVLD